MSFPCKSTLEINNHLFSPIIHQTQIHIIFAFLRGLSLERDLLDSSFSYLQSIAFDNHWSVRIKDRFFYKQLVVVHIFFQQKNNFEQLKMSTESHLLRILGTKLLPDCLMPQLQYYLQIQTFLLLLHFEQLHRLPSKQLCHFL